MSEQIIRSIDWDFPTPLGWLLTAKVRDGACWQIGTDKRVIASMEFHDGLRWCHMSMSKKKGLPSWTDLTMMRDAIVGPDVECYQVIPPQKHYVNIKEVLHLYACMDKPDGILPRFSVRVDGINSI